jgi:ATP-dependent exoDNAse (exonuclease V) beta subunit
MDTAERRRLLYVAMTRARDHLILSGILQVQNAPENTWLAWMLNALPKVAVTRQDGLESSNRSWRLQQTFSTEALVPPPAQVEIRSTRTHENVDPRSFEIINPDVASRLRFTVTELEEYDACPQKFYLKRVKDIAEYHPTGSVLPQELSAADRGTLAHRAMQKLLTNQGSIPDAVEVAFREAGHGLDDFPNTFSSVTSMLETFLAAETWSEFREAHELYLETPFSFCPPGVGQPDQTFVVEGTVDALLVDSEGRAKLVDFKTGQARSEPYTFQLGIYSLGIRAWKGALPESVWLYFMESGRNVELPVKQLASECESRLSEVIEGIIRSEFDRSPDANCGSCGVYWNCTQRNEPAVNSLALQF